ncbi:MAG TPA: GntR family transcriptional regulator, partial [Chloroflexota bacterium]|nr:GntR family transcriptional regulator [Chloroflexota bacterium]
MRNNVDEQQRPAVNDRPFTHTEAAPQLWDAVYQHIKSDIVTLKLPPGQPLRESQIAAQQGVSRTPVREALRRLSYEGLVQIVANSGAIVAEVSLRDFLEITRVRELIEPFVAGAAAGAVDAGFLAELAAEFRRLQIAPRGEAAFHALNEADAALHNALLVAAGNRRIRIIMNNLNAMIDRFRYLSAARVYDDSIEEHL